jgi:uncharacterized protein (TIGR02266 family)
MVAPALHASPDPLSSALSSLSEAIDALRDVGASRRLLARLDRAVSALRGVRRDERGAAAASAIHELGEVLQELKGDGKRQTEHPVAPIVARAIHVLAPLCRGARRQALDAQGRVPILTEVGLHTETNFFTGFSEDFAQGGIFVATYQSVPVDTEVVVTFVLPEGHRVTVHGKVAWVRDPKDRSVSPGVGVRWDALGPDEEALIRAFSRDREPIFHEA